MIVIFRSIYLIIVIILTRQFVYFMVIDQCEKFVIVELIFVLRIFPKKVFGYYLYE